ncbi:MAG TPA: NADH-quinone oxidoreductase subunit L [Geobacterales bacterium]|nr:NADH-quinone oxidoreductase subunit L [Geobacterales bacterium]
MNHLIPLILLFPLLGAISATLLGRFLPRRILEITANLAIWGAFAAALATAALYGGPVTVTIASWLSAFDFVAPITLYLDPLALVMVVMITCICGLIHLYAVAYMANDPGYVRFFALMNLFVFAMLLLVLAENLPLLYLGWEGVGLCSYLLIGFWFQEEKNAAAGRKAFIVTRIGDIAFGLAIIWLFQLFGTVSIPAMNRMGFLLPVGVTTAIGLLFLVAAMGKSAQLPLTVWLPDAMAGPTPVSAQIHAATMVTAGVYILTRLHPLIGGSTIAQGAIALTGAITALYGASCALAQRDLKRLLAYSTISQIGYMVLAVGVGALSAATFHLLMHAAFKALLFLVAGAVITALHHEQDVTRMGGLRQSMPLVWVVSLMGGASLASLPPSSGFFSKEEILAATAAAGTTFAYALLAMALLTALLTSLYTFRLLYLIFGGKETTKPKTLSPLMTIPLLPLALLALAGGLLDLPGDEWLTRFLGGTLLEPHGFIVQFLAIVASLGGWIIVHYRYAGGARFLRLSEIESPSPLQLFLRHGWYLDRLYGWLLVRPFGVVARFLWRRVDEGVVDHALDQLADGLAHGGRVTSRLATGRVSTSLLAFALALAMVLVFSLWRIHT